MTQLALLDTVPCCRNQTQTLLDIAEKMGHDIEFAEGCAEPGVENE